MERKWREYKGEPRTAKKDRAYASISPEGNIVFNRFVFEELGKPDKVVLLIDAATSAIGLRPAAADARNGHKVRNTTRGSTKLIHCSGFIRETGIKVDRTMSFPTARVEYGALVMELKYKVPATRGPRKG